MGKSNMKQFIIRPYHLKLLKHMRVSWNGDEFGAPTIDPKRPYGNGDVTGDIADILAIESSKLVDDKLLLRIHKSMATVLQIMLRCGSISEGLYFAGEFTDDWRPEKDIGPWAKCDEDVDNDPGIKDQYFTW